MGKEVPAEAAAAYRNLRGFPLVYCISKEVCTLLWRSEGVKRVF